MLKIIITDPQLLDRETLAKTGKYLLDLASLTDKKSKAIESPASPLSNVIPPPPPPAPVVIMAPPVVENPVPMPAYNPFAKPQEYFTPETHISNLPWTDADDELTSKDTNSDLTSKDINTVELDVNGLPWDGRIHSRGKSKNVDGTWRYMRGIQDAIVAKVESELRQALAAPAAPIVKETLEAPIADVFKQPVPTPPTFEDPIETPQNDFPTLMTKITAAVSSGKLTQMRLIQIVQSFGLQSVPTIPTRLDLIPAISAAIDKELNGG